MKKLTTTITFECERTVRAEELREFIKDALSTRGGQRHPDDHLFNSLENIQVGGFRPVITHKPKRKVLVY